MVSAAYESSNATGLDGDQTNDAAPVAGAVYIFERSGAAWTQKHYLKASNAQASGVFGSSLAMSADLLVVGSRGEASKASGVGGDMTDRSLKGAGAVYLFSRNGDSWKERTYVKAAHASQGAAFGASVALAPDALVVGAPGESSNATGVGGDPTDTSMPSAGAVSVF